MAKEGSYIENKETTRVCDGNIMREAKGSYNRLAHVDLHSICK